MCKIRNEAMLLSRYYGAEHLRTQMIIQRIRYRIAKSRIGGNGPYKRYWMREMNDGRKRMAVYARALHYLFYGTTR